MKRKQIIFATIGLFLFALNLFGQIRFNSTEGLTLLHYWDFNSTSDCGASTSVNLSPLAPDYSIFTQGATAALVLNQVTSPMRDSTIQSATGGTDLNERPSYTKNDTATGSKCNGAGNLMIKLRNPTSENSFLWYCPVKGYQNIIVSFAVERSNSGPLALKYDYSLDSGKTFITTGMTGSTGVLVDSTTLPTSWSILQLNFSGITAVNNNNGFVVRVMTSGQNTAPKGNDQFDNITVEGSILAGIENIENQLSCSLYPNPSSQFLHVKSGSDANKSVVIYNLLGEVQGIYPFNTKESTIDINGIAPGLYILSIKTKDGSKSSQIRFIKN